MRYGSVCSGIEAATVAWHPMGWKPSFYSEIDNFPRAVLQHHYPEVPLHGDFTTIQENDYEPIELLVGGTPCQSFSVAGLRKGLDDPRGNLMLGFGALAQRLGPTWLVWENVPGVLSANGGRDFGTFLGMLGLLGYGFAYRVLDAQYFGVAQRRRRVFVVGYLGDWRPAAAVLFERHSLSGHPAPSRSKGKDSTGATSQGPAFPILEPGARTGKSTTDPRAGLGVGSSIDPMFTLQAGKQHGVVATLDASYARLQGCSGQDANHGHSHLVVHGTQDPCTSDHAFALGRNNGAENAVMCVTGNISHTLRAEGFDASEDGTGRGTPIIGFSSKDFGGDAGSNIAPTIRAGGHLGSHANAGTPPAVQCGLAVRRLTPVECERLQGFPDNYTRIPYRNKSADSCPDGPRYKALGNSMAVPKMEWIGNRIHQVDEIVKAKSREAAA